MNHLTPDETVEILEAVRDEVRGGFSDADEIVEIVNDSLLDDKVAPDGWLRDQIEEAFAAQRAEEATWPAETDCDRLERAFDELESSGVLALQNAGYTLSDGETQCWEDYQDAGGDESELDGFCFFHGQDLESALRGEGLMIAFGAFEDRTDAATIGRRVRDALARNGLAVEWNGSPATRLSLPGIVWRKRRG